MGHAIIAGRAIRPALQVAAEVSQLEILQPVTAAVGMRHDVVEIGSLHVERRATEGAVRPVALSDDIAPVLRHRATPTLPPRSAHSHPFPTMLRIKSA
jgi:hypothetical protein